MSNITKENTNFIKNFNQQRRKRVDRIKIFIIILGFVIFLLPSISCIILSVNLINLQKQVNKLIILYNQEQLSSESASNVNIAYAAEKPSDKTKEGLSDRIIDNEAQADANKSMEQIAEDVNTPEMEIAKVSEVEISET